MGLISTRKISIYERRKSFSTFVTIVPHMTNAAFPTLYGDCLIRLRHLAYVILGLRAVYWKTFGNPFTIDTLYLSMLLLRHMASRLKNPKIIVSKDPEGTVDLSSSITYCHLLALTARSSNIYCQPCAASTYCFLYCLSPSAVYCAPFPNTYCSFF